MKLPEVSTGKIMQPAVITAFGGLNHNLSAGDGELWDMTNLSSREYPLLRPRGKRATVRTLGIPQGLGEDGKKLFWADSGSFYYDGAAKGTVSPAQKTFAVLQGKIYIFPDKKVYDPAADELADMEATRTGWTAFSDGQLYGVPAKANTVCVDTDLTALGFRAGDAVRLQGEEAAGYTYIPENDKTAVIREIYVGMGISHGETIESTWLRFDENTFVLDGEGRWTCALAEALPAGDYRFVYDGTDYCFTTSAELAAGGSLIFFADSISIIRYSAPGASPTVVSSASTGSTGTLLTFENSANPYAGRVTITREVPDLDFVCVSDNRLWGCKGDAIYASKPGDPLNFNVFDGLSTDSWASETGTTGNFTACCCYQGYPLFFKEDAVFKVVGDRPDNFQWQPYERFGVLKGCDRSLAVAAETLFYLSPEGVCAYTGGRPTLISDALGRDTRWSGAAAGSDGLRYYVSMRGGDAWSLFVYDTRYGLWHREDASHALGFAFLGQKLYMLTDEVSGEGESATAYGALRRLNAPWSAEGTPEASVAWSAEFADFFRFYETTDTASQNKKGLLRLQLRCSLEAGSSLTVKVMYDSDGVWHDAGSLAGAKVKSSFNLPMILRRCDHFRLKLEGIGDAVIYSLTTVKYAGSNLQ
ncbi:MAG: hypothetical protein IKP17_03830 [Oscillospiraceae bacterium]|nr:hypothetical protein [Oscillospiraceae bacterium]MBR4691868.1 hypothetical protein [Oscillospiraceae bacterium]